MKPYVKEVIDLWKSSIDNPSTPAKKYQISEQLRNLASLFAPGLFYYYILNFPKLEMVYVHENTQEVLGIPSRDVTIHKLVELLAPEEREPMAQKEAVVVDFMINFLEPEDMLYYKIAYFFSLEDINGQKRDMLHQATILTLTENNEPEHVMVVHTDVSHYKFVRRNTLSFISLNGKESYFNVNADKSKFIPDNSESTSTSLKSKFTLREKQVIKFIAEGLHSEEIADQLNVSIHTLRTHRKNILRKSSCNSITEVVAKCLVEGVI